MPTPDDSVRFSDEEKQKRWLEFSEQVYQDSQDGLLEGKNFKELYWELAEKRAEIAQELDHGVESNGENRTPLYGRKRKLVLIQEKFYKDKVDSVWFHQADAVLKRFEELMKYEVREGEPFRIFNENVLNNLEFYSYNSIDQEEFNRFNSIYQGIYSYDYIDKNFNTKLFNTKLKEHVRVHFGTPESAFQVTDPENGNLSKIIDFGIKDGNQLSIIYPDLTPDELDKHFAKANDYWHEATQAETKEGFMESMGRCMHLMSHILPVDLGNAGILEWAMESAARSKGYTLEFNFENTLDFQDGTKGNIGWNFGALIEPDREKYAKWFAEKAVSCEKYEEKLPKRKLSNSSLEVGGAQFKRE